MWLFGPDAIFAAVVLRTAELSSLRGVFSSAAPAGLLAAAILAAAFTVNQGALYRGVFRVFGTEMALGDAVVLSLV